MEIRSTPANRINTLRTLLDLIESAQLKGRIGDSVSADLKAMDREPWSRLCQNSGLSQNVMSNVSDECLRTVKNLIRLSVKYGIAAKSHFCHFDFQHWLLANLNLTFFFISTSSRGHAQGNPPVTLASLQVGNAANPRIWEKVHSTQVGHTLLPKQAQGALAGRRQPWHIDIFHYQWLQSLPSVSHSCDLRYGHVCLSARLHQRLRH